MSAPIIDVNVSLSRWPLRRLPLDETPALVDSLRTNGVQQAWTGSYDALLHKDIAAVNANLARACTEDGGGILVPFGTVNPMLPGWEEDLRRCTEEHAMPGIRLHPNYHGYTLDNPAFARLLQLAAERNLIVQITVLLEDERMMHPLLQVPHTDLVPLPSVLESLPPLRLVLLNAFRGVSRDLIKQLTSSGETYVEIAAIEGAAGIAKLLEDVPEERVLFGSHAPLFYFESALLKLRESDLSETQQEAIRGGNARRLLPA